MAQLSDSLDYMLALVLQSELDKEIGVQTNEGSSYRHKHHLESPILIEDDEPSPAKKVKISSLIDPELEVKDPTPDIHTLFMKFNKTFFWNTLGSVEVRWSPRMYRCAGLCSYEYRQGLCSIRLSEPLLKLRPRSDLIETLLHEMIHAYLFLTNNDRDRDGHGPEFQKHMFRINKAAGVNISIYHDFHEEVKIYQKHWWRCDGPCKNVAPFFGFVKRTMNRAPGRNDFWWATHQATCGGKFIKIKEPEKVKPGTGKAKKENIVKKPDIRNYISNSPNKIVNISDLNKSNKIISSPGVKNSMTDVKNNIVGFNDLTNNSDNSRRNIFGGEGKKLGTSNESKSTGAIKKIPGVNVISGKINSEKNIKINNVVGFSDLSKQVNNNSNQNIFSGGGKKLGTGNKSNTGNIAVMNKGSSTFIVKPNLKNNKTNVENKVQTNSSHVIPFSGSGHKLGTIITVPSESFNFHHNLKPNLFNHTDYNNETNSSEKFKNIFHNTSISDDELAEEVNKFQNKSSSHNFHSETNTFSPEKFKNDFLNDSVSDDELVDAVKEHSSQTDYSNSSNSPEKYKNDFLDKSSSDDELCDIDVNYEIKDSDLVPCPVCNNKIQRDDMSIHLQSCDVLNTSLKNMKNSAILEINSDEDDDENDNDRTDEKNKPLQSNITMLPCPCCSKNINESDINKHLDDCLSLLAIKEFNSDW